MQRQEEATCPTVGNRRMSPASNKIVTAKIGHAVDGLQQSLARRDTARLPRTCSIS
ncbi:MAG: hypothetical protein ABI988_04680 [Nitrospirota bacterium]